MGSEIHMQSFVFGEEIAKPPEHEKTQKSIKI